MGVGHLERGGPARKKGIKPLPVSRGKGGGKGGANSRPRTGKGAYLTGEISGGEKKKKKKKKEG